MFKFFRKKKNSINTHTILYEDLKFFPKFLLFKAKLGKNYYTFDIITFRKIYELSIENKKPITNPYDIYNQKIPIKIISKAKRFWKSCIKRHKLQVIEKMNEYNYSIENLNWPKPQPPYPKGVRLTWIITPSITDQNQLLSSFSMYYNNKPLDSLHYYFPRYMEHNKYSQIDTASTTFIAIYYINRLWQIQKLVKRPFILNNTVNILELFNPLTNPIYWKIKDNDYTSDTFELWFEFIENLKIQ